MIWQLTARLYPWTRMLTGTFLYVSCFLFSPLCHCWSEMQALVLNVLAASRAAFLRPHSAERKTLFGPWQESTWGLRSIFCGNFSAWWRQTDPASISPLCTWTRVINTMTKDPGNGSAGLSIWTGFYNKVFNVLTIKIIIHHFDWGLLFSSWSFL